MLHRAWPLLLCAAASAATVPTGPKPGEPAPDFRLEDQGGAWRTLKSIMGPRGLMLVFYRSADWWPFCKGQLVELEQALPRIKAAGLGLAAVSYDSVAVLKQFSGRAGITFPLLSDSDSAVIRRYGILNETLDKETPFYGIPYPGTYILNPAGVVISKYFEDDYRVRDTAASILLRQFGIEPDTHEAAAGKHIALTAAASDREVRPGQRITLSVDVNPGPRVHVYAPGVQNYIPIALTIEPSKAFAADPVSYPPSKTMNLPVIHETVPVYDGTFRMLATVTLANAGALEPLLDQDRNLTIEAKFRYQACDDKECFIPETLPLRWTVHVQPFDRQRVPPEIQRKR